jgi:hypothetical protein
MKVPLSQCKGKRARRGHRANAPPSKQAIAQSSWPSFNQDDNMAEDFWPEIRDSNPRNLHFMNLLQ